jgi:hypothetical protein
VRLCTFKGHHGYGGLTIAVQDSCGERSATCAIATAPPPIDALDVRVELSAATGDAICADRGTRVTGTCVFPADERSNGTGRYPTGISRLAPAAAVRVRVNGRESARITTNAAGGPEPGEQCWTESLDAP